MSGLMLSARDKLMFVMCLTIILFIGVIAVVAVSPLLGIMLILFDFLLAVILLLSGTKPEAAPVEGNLVHQGRYPAVQPGNDTPTA